jgi:death on curing protein
VIYLDVEDLLHVAERVLGSVEIRDIGLLEAAAARPHASAFGEDAYPTDHEKVAALVHSIARNHALVDGNKRLALAGGIAFLGINGWELTATEDTAYDLIIAIASGELDDVASIAARLRANHTPRARTAGVGRNPKWMARE